MKIKLQTKVQRFLADMLTPVTLYLRLRDQFTNAILLENNDFRSIEDCWSFLAFDSIATFEVAHNQISIRYPNGKKHSQEVTGIQEVPKALKNFIDTFEIINDQNYQGLNGLFGHTGFDGVQYFDTMSFPKEKRKIEIPDLRYHVYRFVIAINHFKDELHVLENIHEGGVSYMSKVKTLLESRKYEVHPFKLAGQEESNLTDEEYKHLVKVGKEHCQRGDVFQIVFSRQFSHRFQGDDFNVYRVLRSINPSPYLFYADYGSYRIFGSSPEAQMVIKNGIAQVNPIAGTYRRTGDKIEDVNSAMELAKDPKENAEHIMLVDLARNDLSRHAKNVRVKELKDIQFFSHVIHLVSTVEGDLEETTNPIQVFGDTFPAGTLSGAPKYKAIELINHYENQNRASYGGALGYIDFAGNMTQAIVIRSFLSLNNTLYYQAGAGIVVASDEEKELQEVNNKLGALKKALLEAEKL